MYTGRGPVCGMIIRGGGATGAVGFTGAAACICMTLLCAGDSAVGGPLPTGAAGVVTRGGTAIADEDAVVVEVDDPALGGGVVAGATGTLGGITTTDGGRYVAATDAGVTIRGAGGAGVGASAAGLAGIFGATGATEASAFASTAGGVTGGRTAGRAAGCSATPFCCVIARSTSPGREICERSILVLISSSPCAVRAEVLAALGAASERPRRCFRTRSAS